MTSANNASISEECLMELFKRFLHTSQSLPFVVVRKSVGKWRRILYLVALVMCGGTAATVSIAVWRCRQALRNFFVSAKGLSGLGAAMQHVARTLEDIQTKMVKICWAGHEAELRCSQLETNVDELKAKIPELLEESRNSRSVTTVELHAELESLRNLVQALAEAEPQKAPQPKGISVDATLPTWQQTALE